MIPRLSGDCEGRERIRRRNSIHVSLAVCSPTPNANRAKTQESTSPETPDPQIFSGGGRDEERYRRWIEQNELGYVERIIPFNDVNRKM